MSFGEKILAYKEDILRDLATVIAIPSVCGAAEGKYPYGKEPARALDAVVEMAEKYGLKTKNVDYYAAHAELGEGEELAIVMNHMDVVPAGENWDTDPFEMVEKDGVVYGRGVDDNKGPAIVSLHCLRALKEAGVVGKRRIRVVFGSGEEIGMDDMNHYFAEEPYPTYGFTPDGAYGICHCEKGILHFKIVSDKEDSIVRSFVSGTVVNAVPYKAEADIRCSAEQLQKLTESASVAEGKFEVSSIEGGAHILSFGKACHGAAPAGGFNAAAYLIKLLFSVFTAEEMGSLLTFAYEKIGTSYDGSMIGVDCQDEVSGPLTFNFGIMKMENGCGRLEVDIRYPATLSSAPMVKTMTEAAESYGLAFVNDMDEKPLYLPKDSKLINLLKGAYEDMTGEDCTIYSMGGGTYARSMNNRGVAFGAGWPGDKISGGAHDANERLSIDSLMKHAQICLEAMYRMYTTD
ncbi:MAG: Sapep family Mn(2+)-dependent dipeptidase [Clostridia bacterium]|nr:Sapep family Mn(2+)-dependent dipeptidase [Clostridia bacterium]